MVTNPITKLGIEKLVSTAETKTTYQPAGRLVAQEGHVVSRTRDMMLKKYVMENWSRLKKDSLLWGHYCEPITTIVKSARDSYELSHVTQLLEAAGIPVYEFEDTNQPDYGSVDLKVVTAIATEPVEAEDVLGLIDYLPLWKPNPWDME